MTRKATFCVLMLALMVALAGCRERTDRSEGTVLLSISDFDGLPLVVTASSPIVQADEIILQNIPKDPTGTTSDLMSIELRSYEIRFTRRDTGTRVPPPLIQGVFGLVPVGGNSTLNNLPVMMADQLLNPPIRDLATTGVDAETGSSVILLDANMRFFGRTLSGDDIVSDPARFTLEIRP